MNITVVVVVIVAVETTVAVGPPPFEEEESASPPSLPLNLAALLGVVLGDGLLKLEVQRINGSRLALVLPRLLQHLKPPKKKERKK